MGTAPTDRDLLITLDYLGKDAKREALERLEYAAFQKGYKQGHADAKAGA
jgi:hypothetical protein